MNATGELETAYMQIIDCRKFQKNDVSYDKMESALSGHFKEKYKPIDYDSMIKVQFNPSDLTFSVDITDDSEDRTNINKPKDGNVDLSRYENSPVSIIVGINLVFDRSIYVDSSVQPEVERFLAMVKNPYVRQIAFYWGNMCYKGVMRHVNAEYVMFDESGIPTRANVSLSILVND